MENYLCKVQWRVTHKRHHILKMLISNLISGLPLFEEKQFWLETQMIKNMVVSPHCKEVEKFKLPKYFVFTYILWNCSSKSWFAYFFHSFHSWKNTPHIWIANFLICKFNSICSRVISLFEYQDGHGHPLKALLDHIKQCLLLKKI